VAISVTAMEPAIFAFPVKMRPSTKVSTLPVTLQLTVLAMDRGWESPVRMNGSFMTFSSFSGGRDKDLTAHPKPPVFREAIARAARADGLKSKNPASVAVRREAEEDWSK
jgi:hypothetical protein